MTPHEIHIEHIFAWQKLKPKFDRLGWILTGEYKEQDNGTVTHVVLDPHGRKHWLQIDAEGHICFALTSMKCK